MPQEPWKETGAENQTSPAERQRQVGGDSGVFADQLSQRFHGCEEERCRSLSLAAVSKAGKLGDSDVEQRGGVLRNVLLAVQIIMCHCCVWDFRFEETSPATGIHLHLYY